MAKTGVFVIFAALVIVAVGTAWLYVGVPVLAPVTTVPVATAPATMPPEPAPDEPGSTTASTPSTTH